MGVQHEQNSSAKTGVGTPIYMAPEIIYGGNRYDAKVWDRPTPVPESVLLADQGHMCMCAPACGGEGVAGVFARAAATGGKYFLRSQMVMSEAPRKASAILS